MSAISDYKHTIIPLAIAGVGTAVSGLFNIVVDSEIANAPMAKLVSLSKSYQKDMLFWKDVKTLAMGASIASALALGTFLSIGLTRTAPQIRERDWFLLYETIPLIP